jgi:sugar lactone lactonase YvrE
MIPYRTIAHGQRQRTNRHERTIPMRNFTKVLKSQHQFAAAAFGAAAFALLLTGCGMSAPGSGTGNGTLTAGSSHGLQGVIHGGQSPIYNSVVQLYAMNTGGNGLAATPLISQTITTGKTGTFNISGDYTCPANSQVYIVGTGGDPQVSGETGVVNNTAIALMADLGDCETLKAAAATTFLYVNEESTVAAAYALSSFMTDYTNAGYSTATFGAVKNAYITQNALYGVTTNVSIYNPAPGITVPTTRLNTIANILATCVNSTSSSSYACGQIFTATGLAAAHQNMVAAALAIAHSPAAGVATLYGLIASGSPFQPTLQNPPTDLTLAITYTAGGLSAPQGLAIDAAGNAWVADEGSNAITEIGGVSYISGTNGYTSTAIAGPQAVAIDATGTVWVANTGANNVVALNSSTGSIKQTLTTNLSTPDALAFDGSGNLWVSNFSGNSIAEFTAAGAPVGSGFTTSSLVAPTGIAIDASNTVWVTSSQPGVVDTFNSSGANTGSYTDGLLLAPGGIATDSTNNRVWTAATGISAVVALTDGGATVSGEPYSSGLTTPLSVAVDGSGTVWTASPVTAGTLSAFSFSGAAITPAAGLGTLNQPNSVAIDTAGNLWVTAMGDNSVSEFIGLAGAVTTPLVSSAR